MSGFLEDPSVLTKEKLKSELLANNVALPSGDHRKDVYVQLYLKTLTLQNKEMSQATDTFSSDEDLPPVVVNNSSRSGKKAKRKTDKPQPDDVSVADLPDQGLKDQLEKYGVNAGPVVASTRKLYEKKLQKLLEQGSPTAPPEAPAVVSSRQNGNADSDQYSDKEDEEGVEPGLQSAPEAEAEPLPVVNRPAGSRGKPPVQSKTSNHQDHNQVVEMVTPGDETPSTNGEDVLKDMSPTGMSATCRRPIRGAAGRPVKESDFWLNESLLQRRNLTESSAFYAESGAGQLSYASAPSGGGKRELRFLPVWLQLLLLSVVAGFLIFIFIMETDKLSPSDQSLSP